MTTHRRGRRVITDGETRVLEAIAAVEANRHEIIQNGTCAYMSPRQNGLWVSWHLAKTLCDVVRGTTSERGQFNCEVCGAYGPTKAFQAHCNREDCPVPIRIVEFAEQ